MHMKVNVCTYVELSKHRCLEQIAFWLLEYYGVRMLNAF
jgi:hypothetical protein